MQINELSSVDVVVAGDLLAVFDASNSDTRKMSLTALQTFMQANLTFSQSEFTTQYSTPVTGGTVVITDGTANIHLIITPAGTISTLTLTMPTAPGVIDGQEVLVNSTQAVTTLTLSVNGATAIVGAPSSLSANDFFRLKYDALMTTWYRVG